MRQNRLDDVRGVEVNRVHNHRPVDAVQVGRAAGNPELPAQVGDEVGACLGIQGDRLVGRD
ncbi:MAG TPA: hypothetical protein VIG96_05950, partial [Blastococcus sp.]